jgi:hypothetical protein
MIRLIVVLALLLSVQAQATEIGMATIDYGRPARFAMAGATVAVSRPARASTPSYGLSRTARCRWGRSCW